MDPPEPIHGVIGVDRALGLRVTVKRTSSNVLLGGHSSHTTNPEIKYPNKPECEILVFLNCGKN